jgi:AcrR family transcriptional regulator
MPKKATSKQTNYQRGLDTRGRIVDRSIELFNRYGIQHVTIEDIAADLKISPGNITYYFKLRRDLIRAGLDVLQARLGKSLDRPVVASVQEARDYVISGFGPLWDFRFFFNSLVFLSRNDPEIRTRYLKFQHWAVEAVARDLEGLVTLGYFRRPEAPNSTILMAENMWAQWLSWLRMQQIENPTAKVPNREALYDFALHLWSLCQPLLAARFGQDLFDEFREALAPKKRRSVPLADSVLPVRRGRGQIRRQ